MKSKNYYVSYSHGRGFGCSEFKGVAKDISFDIIRYWKETIQRDQRIEDVIILFFTEIAPSPQGL